MKKLIKAKDGSQLLRQSDKRVSTEHVPVHDAEYLLSEEYRRKIIMENRELKDKQLKQDVEIGEYSRQSEKIYRMIVNSIVTTR